MTCQGSVSASFLRVLVTVGSLAVLNLVAGETYTVGGEAGWTVPTAANGINYTAWAAKYTYYVGDSLVFSYNKDAHNVISLKSGTAMDQCDVNNNDVILKVFDATSSTTVNLTAAGNKWYACQRGNHCASGQKFKITVVDKINAPDSSSAPAALGSLSSFAVQSIVGAAFVLYTLATTLLL